MLHDILPSAEAEYECAGIGHVRIQLSVTYESLGTEDARVLVNVGVVQASPAQAYHISVIPKAAP